MSGTTLINRAVIRVSGDGPRDFLQGLVTNDVAGPLPVYAGLLTAQGKALFDFIVWADPAGGDDVLIDCEASAAPDLARRLTLYRLRRAITIARDDSLGVHWSRDTGHGVPDPRMAALGRRWIAPPGAAAAGWLAHRLDCGVPEGRAEIGDGASLWLEANAGALNGVSFTKGCYIGQENTARMNYRGKVNRQLAIVHADAAPGGARIWYEDEHRAVIVVRTALDDTAEHKELTDG
jgi:tRNA-modifying protein YgfZ